MNSSLGEVRFAADTHIDRILEEFGRAGEVLTKQAVKDRLYDVFPAAMLDEHPAAFIDLLVDDRWAALKGPGNVRQGELQLGGIALGKTLTVLCDDGRTKGKVKLQYANGLHLQQHVAERRANRDKVDAALSAAEHIYGTYLERTDGRLDVPVVEVCDVDEDEDEKAA